MKKLLSTFLLTMVAVVIMPLSPLGTAQATVPYNAASEAVIKPCPSGTYRVRKNTKQGKKIINALILGGVGAAIGGGLGGGRGALLGAGVGSGGYLTYRYIKDRRGRCVPRYVRG